jgi:hypothetical protein
MLPQLVRMIVQPETLLRLPHLHLSTPKRALGGRPVGNAHEFIPENSIRAPLFRPGVHHTGSLPSVLPSFAGDGSDKPH